MTQPDKEPVPGVDMSDPDMLGNDNGADTLLARHALAWAEARN